MLDYPSAFPADAVSTLLQYLRHDNTGANLNAALHAAWVCQGYGMGQLIPVQAAHPIKAAPVPAAPKKDDKHKDDEKDEGKKEEHKKEEPKKAQSHALTRQDLQHSLEGYMDSHNGARAIKAAFPWISLLPVILQVINEIMSKLHPAQ